MATADDLAIAIGSPGRFQVVLCLMVSVSSFFVSWGYLGMAFYAAETDHHCLLPNSSTNIDDFIPTIKENGKEVLDRCHLYSDVNKTTKISCTHGWTYNLSDGETTIISEWDLVCDDVYKSNIVTVLFSCGMMLGILFGQLSDKFGRKPVFLFTTFSHVIVGIVIFFTNNYIVFVFCRFVLGSLVEGLQSMSYVIPIELFASKYRTTFTLFNALFWGIGVMILALISFVLQDWRKIHLFTTACVLVQVPLIWFLPESFRWLFTQNKVDDARAVVERITKFNKLRFPREIFDDVAHSVNDKDDLRSKRVYTFFDLLKSRELRKRLLIAAFVWNSIVLTYVGLTLENSKLAGNKYLNFFIGGVLEVVIVVIIMFIFHRCGRRKLAGLFLILAGIACLVSVALRNNNESLDPLRTSLSLFGRMCLSGDMAVMLIYTAELFPTVVRSVGLGFSMFGARVGYILAPQINLIGSYTYESVPYVIFGSFALLAGLSLRAMPETLNVKLPETIEEVHKKTESNKVAGSSLTIMSKTENVELPDSTEREVKTNSRNVAGSSLTVMPETVNVEIPDSTEREVKRNSRNVAGSSLTVMPGTVNVEIPDSTEREVKTNSRNVAGSSLTVMPETVNVELPDSTEREVKTNSRNVA
ncbi:organic cation transporter protein-like isoform X1 [Xenia sp. Carnegie-2017]|uniref:organic cation transporter protein-like isoform X1 n=2 Tax=Xenia sp. Carnegie-2017 TaxID=2897299 RepID=UPI001F0343CB|nr:organic cation transporter protein-like isoform X1 [Xenia sp. Carnegie-2017]XP_046845863.1 organic cation transporter protein-like isoform X1 [Xenia sp. Carnegie-2017]